MTLVDWIIVAVYFAVAAGVGLAVMRRAGGSTSDYFLGGRALPWWLAGTSMVATTFAADTPLAVTEMVAAHGVAGNCRFERRLAEELGKLRSEFHSALPYPTGSRTRDRGSVGLPASREPPIAVPSPPRVPRSAPRPSAVSSRCRPGTRAAE